MKQKLNKIKRFFCSMPSKTKSFFVKLCLGIKKIPQSIKSFSVSAKNEYKNFFSNVKKAISRNKKVYSFFHKIKEFFVFVDENRKISYPVLILVYTVVIVALTIAAERAHIAQNLAMSSERKIVEEMEKTPAHSTLMLLMQGQPCVVSEKCTVEYRGSAFEKKINPSKAEEFGSSYENHLESNVYMDVVIAYTNTTQNTIKGSEAIKMTARCDNTEYNCFTAIETDEGKNIEFANNVEIAAGQTAVVHCIFDVPSDTKDASTNIMAELVADNRAYIIDVK